MKLKKLIYTILVAAIVVASGTGCSKESFNINKNPNQPTDSTISYDVILASALNSTGRLVARDWGWLQNWLGYWARSGTYAPNVAEETYQITTGFQANIWTDLYDNLYDYQTMQNAATKSKADFYAGIARIMKAHDYQLLVDIYNNVPYSQALKGNANTTPKYDKGIDIYKDLFRQLDTGIALIKGANSSETGPNKNVLNDDIMFGVSQFPIGSAKVADYIESSMKPKWIKFANTLKLRLLVHLTNGGVLTPAARIAGIDFPTEVAKITATNVGYLTAGLDAEVNPGYKSDKQNPFYDLYVKDAAGTATQNSVYYKANSYAIGYYGYNGDDRRSQFYVAGGNGMVGVAYGLPSATVNAAANLAGIGPGLTKSNTASQWILTATESLFLQAEAMSRGIIAGSADATMQNAIIESFTMIGLTPTDGADYIAFNAGYPDVDYTAAPLVAGRPGGGIFTIISQKWFALNGIAPFEVWADYRRVNISATVDHFVYGQAVDYAPGPPLSVSPANTATKIPIRLLYPQNEYNYNAANVGNEGTINAFSSRIFWDN